jgi:hypothetical protein
VPSDVRTSANGDTYDPHVPHVKRQAHGEVQKGHEYSHTVIQAYSHKGIQAYRHTCSIQQSYSLTDSTTHLIRGL